MRTDKSASGETAMTTAFAAGYKQIQQLGWLNLIKKATENSAKATQQLIETSRKGACFY